MQLGLQGQVAFVTGGSAGIGRAACLALAEEGCLVVVAGRDEGRAKKVAGEIAVLGGKSLAVLGDVTRWEEVDRMFKTAIDAFGHIDVLANVAGGWRNDFFMKMRREDWDFEIDVNFKGVLNSTRAALEYMVPRKSGCIVSVGSDSGRSGEPHQPVYGASKAAVIGFSRALAKDVARHKIRVNVVCASSTITESRLEMEERMLEEGDRAKIQAYQESRAKALKGYPLRKFGQPQDVANMIVFLASPLRCGHVTGQTISVNGGYFMG